MNLVNIVDPQNEKTKSELCLGIDFGTTNSVCSIKKDNKIVFVEDFDKKVIPSIILFKKKILVGNQIQEIQKMSDLIFSIKRYFTKDPDKKEFSMGGDEKKSAIEVAKEIFSYIKKYFRKIFKKKHR